jgi:hypothetical protein
MTEAEGASAPTSSENVSVDDLEQVREEAEARGYEGTAPEYDRDAYTLRTGPESPSTHEALLEAKQAEVNAQLDELHAPAQARSKSAQSGSGSQRSTRHASSSSSKKES